MMIQKSTCFQIVLIFFLISGYAYPAAGEDLSVRAYVDRTSVGVGQRFTLQVELSGEGANNAANPELPDLGAFAAFLGSGSSQNIQIINGKMSASKTISYHFQAIAEGTFQIPPVVVKASGKEYRTDPVSMTIQKGAAQAPQPGANRSAPVQGSGPAEGDLFVRATADKRTVYQNQPVLVTYQIFTRVNINSFGFSKQPGTAGFWVEEYPQDQQPQTHTEVLDGQQYMVATIKKMALFPMTPGEKTIDPLEVECEVRVRQQRRDIFDDFFSDPFGRTVRRAVQSKPVTISVLPFPEESKPESFSGVVGQFRLSGEIDKTSVQTNEAVSFKIRIEGDGNIRTITEPNVQFPADFERYPPKVSEQINRHASGVSGSKTFEYVLVPRAPGEKIIKSVALTVFDPIAKSYRTLRTRPFTIHVTKGKDVISAAPAGLSKEEVALLGQDIRFIKTSAPDFRPINAGMFRPILFWIAILFPLAGLGAALGYRRHIIRLEGDVAYARGRKASRTARKRLGAARAQMNPSSKQAFFAEMGRALLGFLGDKLNIPDASIMTDRVQELLKERRVNEETIAHYVSCLTSCDMMRFSPTEITEEAMRSFYRKAEEAIAQLEKEL